MPRVMDYAEVCFIHLALGVVHNIPKTMVRRVSVPNAQYNPRISFIRQGLEETPVVLVPKQ